MQTLDIVRVVAIVIAFAGAASKLLSASKGFWDYFPIWLQRVLPGAVLVLGELPAALTGVRTWTDFAMAVLGALALALPGRHPNSDRVAPVAVLALLFALPLLTSCSSATDEDVASIRQELQYIHPDCVSPAGTLRPGCGTYCCTSSCRYWIKLSSVAQNIYYIAPIGGACYGVTGPINGPNVITEGAVVQ
jgi:hypothetical protein